MTSPNDVDDLGMRRTTVEREIVSTTNHKNTMIRLGCKTDLISNSVEIKTDRMTAFIAKNNLNNSFVILPRSGEIPQN